MHLSFNAPQALRARTFTVSFAHTYYCLLSSSYSYCLHCSSYCSYAPPIVPYSSYHLRDQVCKLFSSSSLCTLSSSSSSSSSPSSSLYSPASSFSSSSLSSSSFPTSSSTSFYHWQWTCLIENFDNIFSFFSFTNLCDRHVLYRNNFYLSIVGKECALKNLFQYSFLSISLVLFLWLF